MTPTRARSVAWALAVALVGLACSGRPPGPATPAPAGPAPAESIAPSPSLPGVAPVRGPLALRVVYPPSEAVLQIRDSSFVFGTAGSGDARVTIDGQAARVWPNGAWLAYVALPADSFMQLRIEARRDTDSVALVYPLRRRLPDAGRYAVGSAWLDSLSLIPTGRLWLGRGEYLALGVRAAEGASVRLRLADGTILPLSPQPQRLEVPATVRAFDGDTTRLRTPIVRDRYVGLVRGRPLGPDPGAILPLAPVVSPTSPATTLAPPAGVAPFATSAVPSPDSLWPVVEAIVGTDTARVRWPLQVALVDTLPIVAELDDDSTGTGMTDSMTVGRALPGGTYAWFFPTGTRAAVTGRRNGDVRLRLSQAAEAWVPAIDARPLTPGGPAPHVIVGSVSVTRRADRATVRIPLSQRAPFRVEETDRTLVVTLYGATGDVDWIRYGPADSLIRRVSWRQVSADEVALTFELERPLWGYRTRWDRTDLLLDIRRPPDIDGSDPLRGRLIAVDPGHPPGGAIGPTGLREAEANLSVALELRRLLEAAGAAVVMTRVTDSIVELAPRVALAEAAGAEVLLSIHNNALPDGINPFVNNGTSVYYNQPRSVPLARAIQAALLRRLGLRDLGVGRGDLALVRGTWMPSVLTEGLFMMLPDQEAALRSPEGQRLYAQAVADGLRAYLEDRARDR
ncbi:MAG: N-acetylmuramoyl-L-alanine amidase [Gemmatimonadales bacterium]